MEIVVGKTKLAIELNVWEFLWEKNPELPSAQFAVKRHSFGKRVRKRKVKPICNEGKHYEKKAMERSSVCERNLVKATLVNSESGRKYPACDLVATKHSSLTLLNMEDNFLEVQRVRIERGPVACLRKKLLILDVNGLLADIVHPPPRIFKRPFCNDFLKFCFERFDVGIWSSRTKKLWEKHDANLPWGKGCYNASNTLLLDDSPYKALLNPKHTAIFPYSYDFKDSCDNSLGPEGDIQVYLRDLVAAGDAQNFPAHALLLPPTLSLSSPLSFTSCGYGLRPFHHQRWRWRHDDDDGFSLTTSMRDDGF
ncbi:hypothetical protein C3L33_01463, partial [Rhododendron williamsianum]